MKQTIIPAGYRLSVTSWENDGDAYHIEIIEGLTKERVDYALELCNLFQSRSYNTDCFGNMYQPNMKERLAAEDAIRAVLEKHRAVLTTYELEQLAIESDLINQYGGPEFNQIVGEFLSSSEDYLYRAYHDAKVEFVPSAIIMEDVTGEFDV